MAFGLGFVAGLAKRGVESREEERKAKETNRKELFQSFLKSASVAKTESAKRSNTISSVRSIMSNTGADIKRANAALAEFGSVEKANEALRAQTFDTSAIPFEKQLADAGLSGFAAPTELPKGPEPTARTGAAGIIFGQGTGLTQEEIDVERQKALLASGSGAPAGRAVGAGGGAGAGGVVSLPITGPGVAGVRTNFDADTYISSNIDRADRLLSNKNITVEEFGLLSNKINETAFLGTANARRVKMAEINAELIKHERSTVIMKPDTEKSFRSSITDNLLNDPAKGQALLASLDAVNSIEAMKEFTNDFNEFMAGVAGTEAATKETEDLRALVSQVDPKFKDNFIRLLRQGKNTEAVALLEGQPSTRAEDQALAGSIAKTGGFGDIAVSTGADGSTSVTLPANMDSNTRAKWLLANKLGAVEIERARQAGEPRSLEGIAQQASRRAIEVWAGFTKNRKNSGTLETFIGTLDSLVELRAISDALIIAEGDVTSEEAIAAQTAIESRIDEITPDDQGPVEEVQDDETSDERVDAAIKEVNRIAKEQGNEAAQRFLEFLSPALRAKIESQ